MSVLINWAHTEI